MAGRSSEEGAHSSMHVALDRGRWGTGGGTQAKGQDLRARDQEGGKWPNDVAMLIGGGGGCFFFPNGCLDVEARKLKGAAWRCPETFLVVTALERATSDIWWVKVRRAVKHNAQDGPCCPQQSIALPKGSAVPRRTESAPEHVSSFLPTAEQCA